MQEQKPQPEREGKHDADRHVALCPFAERAQAHSRREGEGRQAENRRQSQQSCPGGPGKGDVRQGMAREDLASQHQEISDAAADERDGGAGGEGVAHEFVAEHR